MAHGDEGTSFKLGAGTRAGALTFGPDGRLWFTASTYAFKFGNVVGSVSRQGAVDEHLLEKRSNPEAGGITVGPDRNLWFADPPRSAIGKITPSGEITMVPSTTYRSGPRGVAAGPDGRVWFTEPEYARVGRVDTGGAIESFFLAPGSRPSGIALGADGGLWVTEKGGNRIARITTAGEIAEFPLPHPDSGPDEISASPDGSLWFTEEGASRIGRIFPSGRIVEYALALTGAADPIAVGPDGTAFIGAGTEIGSISSQGVLGSRGCVTFACDLPVTALTLGPEGDLWYATGVRHTGGGGGTQLMELQVAGTVGKFVAPGPVRAWIQRRPVRVHGSHAKLSLECQGHADAICVGRVRVVAANGPHILVAQRLFRLRATAKRSISLRLRERALEALGRRGHLRVIATTVAEGGPVETQELVLRPFRRSQGRLQG